MLVLKADDARRRFGAVLKIADIAPVAITRHRRKRYVLMSAEVYDLYERLRQSHAGERVFITADRGVEMLLRGEDGKGLKLLKVSSAIAGKWLKATGEKL